MEDEARDAAAVQNNAATEDGDPDFARAMMDMDLPLDNSERPAEAEAEDDAEKKPAESDEDKAAREAEEAKAEEAKKAEEAEKAEEARAAEEAEAESGRKLSPEAQAAVDRRIGKEVARRKEIEELLDGERALNRELRERLEKTATAEVSPLAMADSEQDLQKREDYLWRVVEWCEDNADGYEGDGTEQNPPYTPEEIRQRLRAARRELQRELPKARSTLTKRMLADAEAVKAYPELANADGELAAAVDGLLRELPFMKAVPECRTMLADMAAGRKARLAASKTNADDTRQPAAVKPAAVKPAATKAKPARAPAAPGSPAAAAPVAPAGGGGSNPDRKFADGGYTDEALVDAYME
jgi:hypothetical protein